MITNDSERSVQSGLEWNLLREASEHLSEGVCVFDANHRLVICSELAASLSRMPPDLLKPGVHLRDLLIMQAQLGEFGPCNPVEEADRRIADLSLHPSTSYRRRHPDGRMVEVRRRPLSGGAFMKLYADITARRQAEEQRDIYRLVVNSITDVVSVMDVDMKYLFVNDAFCQVTGWDRKEVIGKVHGALIPAVMNAERRNAMRTCIQLKTPQVVDAVLQLPGGGKRSIETTYFPYVCGTGEVTGVVLFSRDNTQRVADGLRAREDFNFIRRIADNIPGMVGYWDRNLRCGFANSQYMTWFGRAADEMPGIHIRDLMGEEVYRKNERHILGALAGQDQQFERTLIKPTGEAGHTLSQYIVDRVDDQVRGFFVLSSDITDVHRREQEREAAHTAQRNALVREVHHRIKNNLQGVTGLLAQYGLSNPEMKPVLNHAITQVLSVATIHGLQGRSGTRNLNLLELVESIEQQVRQIWGTVVAADLAAELGNWQIDPQEAVPVALILNELLSNAAKHADPCLPEVTLQGRPDGDRQIVQIRISNRAPTSGCALHESRPGVGLQLVASLLPREGATMKCQRIDQQFVAILELAAPVVSEQPSH